jgi:hypothetical protein
MENGDAGRQSGKAPLAWRALLYGTTSYVVPDLAERAMRSSPKKEGPLMRASFNLNCRA